MKYSCAVDIDLPRERVVELVLDPAHYSDWQPGLLSYEPLSNGPEPLGRKTKLRFKMGKREIEMVETVTEYDAPEGFSLHYAAKSVENTMRNRFTPINEGRTRWTADVEFKMAGMMKVVAFLMPKMFRSETEKTMRHFKEFSEKAAAVGSV